MPKTIFRSTEKSNFILNMTEDQYAKLASAGIIAACFMTSVFTAIPTLFDTKTYTFSAAGLAVSGVICMIFAMIALIKKYIKGSLILPTAAFGAMLLWGIVSMVFSYDYTVAVYGFPQRGEGILALLFYFCCFVMGASVKREKAVSALTAGVVGIGILNSVWAILQIFVDKLSEPIYTWLASDLNCFAASGLSQSPIFLAMVLSLSLTAAAVDAVMTSSKKRMIFDIVCMCLFSFVMVFTHSLMGIYGLVFGIVAVIAAVVKSKAPKAKLALILAIIVPALGAYAYGSNFKADANGDFKLYDGYIVWADSFHRAGASGVYNPNRVDLNSTADVYSFLNGETVEIIKKYPITGTGPEQLVYPQIYTTGGSPEGATVSDYVASNAGTFDKVYNEYLYTAATRGIPSLIAMVIVLLAVVASARKNMKNSFKPARFMAYMLTVCGVLAFLIGCSNITFSPIFWVCAGVACAHIETPNERKKSAKKASKA